MTVAMKRVKSSRCHEGGKRRYRILITGPLSTDPGGVSNLFNTILPALRSHADLSVEYLELGSSRRAGGILHPVLDQIRFRGAIAKARPDIVHVNPSLTARSIVRDGLLVRQARRQGIPTVAFFHGWDKPVETAIDRRWRWLFRYLFGDVSVFAVLASEFSQKLRNWGILAPIVQLATAVPDQAFWSGRSRNSPGKPGAQKALRVLFLARLEHSKGVLETIDGVAQLVKAGKKIKLTVAGDGPAMSDVRRLLAHDPVLRKDVIVTGYVRGQEKAKLFESHNVYCFPTRYGEGMPVSLLEAMAAGMAIISSSVGGIKDFFQEGKMGFLLNVGSGREVAQKLELFLGEPQLVRKMGDFNRKYAEDHFSANHLARNISAMYDRLLPEPTII